MKDRKTAGPIQGQSANPDELLDRPTLAAELLASEPTLDLWRNKGTGPDYIRVGRLIRYRRSDVDRWLEERTQRQAQS